MRPLFWLSTIAQGANKVPQGGVSLPFIGSLRVWRLSEYTVQEQNYFLKGDLRFHAFCNKMNTCAGTILQLWKNPQKFEPRMLMWLWNSMSSGRKDSDCCLCLSSTFLQSVRQNIRAVLQLAGRSTPVIACQALLNGMGRNAPNMLGWNAQVWPQRESCRCSNTMVRVLLRQARPDGNLRHICRKLVDSKRLAFEPHLIGLFELPWAFERKPSALGWACRCTFKRKKTRCRPGLCLTSGSLSRRSICR